MAFVFILLSEIVVAQNNYGSGLHALLVVGHQEDGTGKAIARMNEIARLLEENKVVVHKFYDDQAIWNNIIKIAPRCSFFVYSGHGSNLGIDGETGGLCLTSMISTSILIKHLKLKNNALVVFQSVCRGAGSSAGDIDNIGLPEAKKRVTNYAYPFLEIGAQAYYANNFVRGALGFLKDFFTGISLKEAYVTSARGWTTIEFEESFKKDTIKSISIASIPGGGISTMTTYTNGVKKVEDFNTPKSYEIAYVGKKDFSISDMNENLYQKRISSLDN